ncbi:hypothetical protein GQ42DRAFT_156219 [Ramicandelaber brevisporus]|nr:hypothetical protein GQ42DRAFT_156219 [Ramicandelaber brevisporus]
MLVLRSAIGRTARNTLGSRRFLARNLGSPRRLVTTDRQATEQQLTQTARRLAASDALRVHSATRREQIVQDIERTRNQLYDPLNVGIASIDAESNASDLVTVLLDSPLNSSETSRIIESRPDPANVMLPVSIRYGPASSTPVAAQTEQGVGLDGGYSLSLPAEWLSQQDARLIEFSHQQLTANHQLVQGTDVMVLVVDGLQCMKHATEIRFIGSSSTPAPRIIVAVNNMDAFLAKNPASDAIRALEKVIEKQLELPSHASAVIVGSHTARAAQLAMIATTPDTARFRTLWQQSNVDALSSAIKSAMMNGASKSATAVRATALQIDSLSNDLRTAMKITDQLIETVKEATETVTDGFDQFTSDISNIKSGEHVPPHVLAERMHGVLSQYGVGDVLAGRLDDIEEAIKRTSAPLILQHEKIKAAHAIGRLNQEIHHALSDLSSALHTVPQHPLPPHVSEQLQLTRESLSATTSSHRDFVGLDQVESFTSKPSSSDSAGTALVSVPRVLRAIHLAGYSTLGGVLGCFTREFVHSLDWIAASTAAVLPLALYITVTQWLWRSWLSQLNANKGKFWGNWTHLYQ